MPLSITKKKNPSIFIADQYLLWLSWWFNVKNPEPGGLQSMGLQKSDPRVTNTQYQLYSGICVRSELFLNRYLNLSVFLSYYSQIPL